MSRVALSKIEEVYGPAMPLTKREEHRSPVNGESQNLDKGIVIDLFDVGRTVSNSPHHVEKLLRAYGGCLGAKCR